MQVHEKRAIIKVAETALPGAKVVTVGDNHLVIREGNSLTTLGPIVLSTPELSREIGKMVSKLHSKKGPLNREPLNEYEMSLVPWHHVIKPEELYCIPNWRFRVPRYLRRVRNADVGFDQHGNLVWVK